MELPAYHMPTVGGVLIHTWQRVKGYMLKAGVIIFPACVFLWFIMHFDWAMNLLSDEELEKSILHDLGSWIAWVFAPLGFGTWQGAAATVSAEIAKEQATATLGLVSAGFDGATTASNIEALFGSMSDFPRLAAFSFMVFNLFVPPCMVAIATTFREMGSKAWGWFAIVFQLVVGYVIALSAYQVGMLACGGGFGFWTAATILVDLAALWAIFRPAAEGGRVMNLASVAVLVVVLALPRSPSGGRGRRARHASAAAATRLARAVRDAVAAKTGNKALTTGACAHKQENN